MNHEYHFLTHWRIPRASVEDVFKIIADVEALPQWWPSVYLGVRAVDQRTFELHTKGWLPYTLRWQMSVDAAEPPHFSRIGAHGDFEGRGIWTLWQEGRDVHLLFDWKLLAQKPLLRTLSPALKPAFAANHRWAMRQGERSLRQEVLRRRGRKAPPPPPPTSWQPWAALAVGFMALAVLSKLTRRK